MIKTGVAARPMPGQEVSGDAWFVHEAADSALIVVIDGLGHGPGAYTAAQKAYAVLTARPQLPLPALMQACHTATQGSRGAVAGMLRLHFGDHSLRYVGVGNISIHVVSRRQIKPISRNGTVGYRLPSLFEQQNHYDPGDTFILFSDGISMRFVDQPFMNEGLSPQALADRIMAEYGKASDDATVLVVQA